MPIIEINNNQQKQWDDFVEAHPEGNIYQTWAWRQLIEQAYGQKPVYIALTSDSGRLIAALPFFRIKSNFTGNRLTSLPGAQFCNPLVQGQQDYQELLEHALSLLPREKARYLEVKTSGESHSNGGDTVNGYCCFTLDLRSPIQEMQKKFHPSCIRRAIKKAQKAGLELKVGNARKDMKIFFDFYLKMRKTNGLIPQPLNFFYEMWDQLRPSGRIEILHAESEGQIIASIILLKYKKTVIYEYGASDPAKSHLRPSPFLLWQAIQRAKNEGYEIFDFGRTSTDNDGLMKFKERWGAQRLNLEYHYHPHLRGFGSARQNGLSKRIMYHSVKNSPPSIVHLMGKIFYRNFI